MARSFVMVNAFVSAVVGSTMMQLSPYVIQNGGIKIDGRPSTESVGTHIAISANQKIENTDPVPAILVIDSTSQISMFDNTALTYTGNNGTDSANNEIFVLKNGAFVYSADPVDTRNPNEQTPRRRRVVRTPNRSTIAIGTSFFIKNEVGNFRLAVFAGVVEFNHQSNSSLDIRLKQGDFVEGKNDEEVSKNKIQ